MPGNEHRHEMTSPAHSDAVDSFLREAVHLSEPAPDVLAQLKLSPGHVLSDRFVIQRLAGRGGMGTIHRATDLQTHAEVAIKVMSSERVSDANRFGREAIVLAELSHAAIVRYIAHGKTPAGTLFLAMEWLDGEDLAQRLAHSRLSVEESLALLRCAASGLAAAHARGVVHRDIKPSNLFLVDGSPASVKVLDFGIARQAAGLGTMTQTGAVLGTVGYMAPEQAMGLGTVDARADVFALGCVLFECLTGRAAFVGPNAVAVLAKVLREDPPRVSELCPRLGAALDQLVARLLAKLPEERPADAAAVLRALDELKGAVEARAPSARPQPGLTTSERKIVSVIIGGPAGGHTAPAEPSPAAMSGMQELLRRFGTQAVDMRGGGLLVVLTDRGAATDQASDAARCALLLRRSRPDLRLAVATGRAQTTERIPVGAVIDRAAELLVLADVTSGVAIDELTAGLLGPGFSVRRELGQLILAGERGDAEATRLLMGKPTRFVGRDKELALLELTLRECIEESVARAVLVTGPPGQGKSRLRHELVARAREREGLRVLLARADSIGAGSAFMIARQLVRQAASLREGDVLPDHATKLRAYLAEVCKADDFERIADFLGELIGVPSVAPAHPALRAARNDPQLMSVWLRRSFGAWLAAECAQAPLLIVLEDLHWGDVPSVEYLSDALRSLAARPLMVLGLARVEVHVALPKLLQGAELQEITLGRLTPRAAERLAREGLGEPCDERMLSRIVAQADGNPFYLEELIRRIAEGDSDSLPETVLALVQSRLERLDPAARLVVRAASIFGEVVWSGAVAALLPPSSEAFALEEQLSTLVVNEVLVVSAESRFPGERQYAFRHALLREAAYAMLTEVDRAEGHRLAGEWLERAGEQQALAIADHFELAGQPKRAVRWLVQAAQRAFDGGNIAATLQLGDRAIACGADEHERGLLDGVRASVLLELGDILGALAVYREAAARIPASSPDWLLAAANLFATATFADAREIAAIALRELLAAPVQPVPSGPYGFAIFATCGALASTGELEFARAVLERAEAMQRGAEHDDPVFVACVRAARGVLHLLGGELARALGYLQEARTLADQLELSTQQASSRYLLIAVYAETGSSTRAETTAGELRSFFEQQSDADHKRARPGARGGRRFFYERSEPFLATALLNAGRVQEAVSLLRPLVERPDRQLAISARARLAHALLAAGELNGARAEANVVLAECESFPSTQPTALGALAMAAFQLRHYAQSLELAERGLTAAARMSWLRDGSILRLVRAEALHALGQRGEARAAIAEARERIKRIAATLEDPELRSDYLTNIAANARTLSLASAWLDEDAA